MEYKGSWQDEKYKVNDLKREKAVSGNTEPRFWQIEVQVDEDQVDEDQESMNQWMDC